MALQYSRSLFLKIASRTRRLARNAWCLRASRTPVCNENLFETLFLAVEPKAESIHTLARRKQELLECLGLGMDFYQRHIRQCDYVVVHAAANDEQAQELRQRLEASSADVVVAGSWSIPLGDYTLSVWETLIRSSTTVLVLVSEALFQDPLPVFTAMAAMTDHNPSAIVPIFLEDIPSDAIPDGLSMLKYRHGIDLFILGLDSAVNCIARHTSVATRYERETVKLQAYIDKFRNLRRPIRRFTSPDIVVSGQKYNPRKQNQLSHGNEQLVSPPFAVLRVQE